jgi:hypothetical protein
MVIIHGYYDLYFTSSCYSNNIYFGTIVAILSLQISKHKESSMNWIEIIDLRSVGNSLESLKQTLLKPVAKTDRKNGLKSIDLYHNFFVETDISIHLKWETKKRAPGKSDLGLGLASALKEFGRVNHAIWLKD